MTSMKSSMRFRLRRKRSPADIANPPEPLSLPLILAKQPKTKVEAVSVRATATDSDQEKAAQQLPSTQSRIALPLTSSGSNIDLNAPGSQPSSANVTTLAPPLSPILAKPPQTNLFSLPSELILHLTTFLPFNALLALRSTCHPLYHLLSSSHLTTQRNNITSSLLASERNELHDYRHSHPRQPYSHLWDLFYAAFEWQLQERPARELICYGCLETKPLHCFVERMSSRGTGLGGKLAKHRRCKDCMRRFYAIGGSWWREHWVRKSEHRKYRTRMERVGRWISHGDSLVENVERGEEVGVCACCGGRQSELWWGCKGCFEKEERRRRREDVDAMVGSEEQSEKWMEWVVEKTAAWAHRRDRKRRRRETRRAEQGRRWRRMWRCTRRGGVLRWEGSWEGRIEALVELLQGTGKDNSSYERLDAEIDGKHKSKVEDPEWKPLDHITLTKDRREARCSMCWVPKCLTKTFMLGLAYETNLQYEHWCGDCQREDEERQEKRQWRKDLVGKGVNVANVSDEEVISEGMRLLFAS